MQGAAAAVLAVTAALAVAGAGACQGQKQSDGGGGARPADAAATADASAAAAGSAGSGAASSSAGGAIAAGAGSGKAGSPEDPEAPVDPSKQIAELGAIPAWQAVVDRAQLLARRGQKGVLYGRLGPAVVLPAQAPAPAAAPAPAPAPAPAAAAAPAPAPAPAAAPAPPPADGGVPSDAGAAAPAASPYVWLVDDTEGNGSLGIRLALGKLQAKEGDRIAVSGAWELDAERRWYWKALALQPLAPLPPQATYPSTNVPVDPPPPVPSHVPATGGFPPNVRLIKQAKDNDAVYFQLTGALPAREGDGWLIAGQFGEPPVALLVLPGERPSYGGHDMRSPDERWQLRRQQTYWVRIGKVRPQGAGKPFLVNARTAPIRVM